MRCFFVFKIILLFVVLFLSGCGNTIDDVAPTEVETDVEVPQLKKENVYFDKNYIEGLSATKESWGMRRNPPLRPEFTTAQAEMMDKYGCIYMGAGEQKYLYLTFDEGYENGQTGKILDVLKDKGVKAAFFITGDYFKTEGELIDRMVNEGHIVGNHTMNHPCVPKIENAKKIEDEVLSLDRAFYEKYKIHMKYFRPPEGAYSEKTLAITKNLGYTNVFWSFAYDDWYQNKQRGADYAYNKTMENLHPGCVILLHAVSRDNAEALGNIIDSARSGGYEFLSLDEYIGEIN